VHIEIIAAKAFRIFIRIYSLWLWLWQTADSSSRQRECPTSTSLKSVSDKALVLSPRWVLYSKTDRPTDRLTVGRNITSTLTDENTTQREVTRQWIRRATQSYGEEELSVWTVTTECNCVSDVK
jgi:hypothetical protein